MDKRLAMHHISKETSASNAHYSLIECDQGHITIRISDNRDNFKKALVSVTGLELPSNPLQTTHNEQFTIHWVSPDEFLLLTPAKQEFEVESQLRSQMTGHYAIVNVTSAQTILELAGKRAETILKKSTPYDIHPSSLSVGKVVTTVFAKTQVILWRTDSEQFSLVIRRSFSDYLWRWIVDAGSRD